MVCVALLLVFAPLVAAVKAGKVVKNVVLFGDSYTDQSRQHSIANGTFPGKNYQQVYPPNDHAASGGFQWPWYLAQNSNLRAWNYAVGGAVCSNKLTPLFDYPDVSGGQIDWFIEDHVANTTGRPKLLLPGSETVAIIFVGTNDLGIRSFVTDSQSPNVTLVDLASCQFDTARRLAALGIKNIIINSLIPLQLTRLYAADTGRTIYWPQEHDAVAWNKRMANMVKSLNWMLKQGASALDTELGHNVNVRYFDTYKLFEEMYYNPRRWFDSSIIEPDVKGHCHQCRNPDDWRECGVGDCKPEERDAYMWWDELHPSEQAGRNLAKAMQKEIQDL